MTIENKTIIDMMFTIVPRIIKITIKIMKAIQIPQLMVAIKINHLEHMVNKKITTLLIDNIQININDLITSKIK
jgi:hypothetical protein